MSKQTSTANPIAWAVTVAIDYPDNHADSDFIGLFPTYESAKQAVVETLDDLQADSFDCEPDEEWDDNIGNYIEICRNYCDGGLYAKAIPIYNTTDDNPWLKNIKLSK